MAITHSSPRRPAARPAVSTVEVGHRLLGVTADWELFGLASRALVSIEPARGRITRTTLPPLAGDGLASLVVSPGQAIIRPLDSVRGYLVPDGKPPRLLTGALSSGGQLLPGPAPADDWLVSQSIVLVGRDGQAISARLPGTGRMRLTPVTSDGRGGLVLQNTDGMLYDADLGSLRPIGAQLLVAAGPRAWLAMRCSHQACRSLVINAATGARRTLPGTLAGVTPFPWTSTPGVVAPDASTAAVIVSASQGGTAGTLELINLRSGAVTGVAVPVGQPAFSETLAWSPDSRWLFVVTASGTLAAVDAHTGLAQGVDLGLSGLSQIAIIPGSG